MTSDSEQASLIEFHHHSLPLTTDLLLLPYKYATVFADNNCVPT